MDDRLVYIHEATEPEQIYFLLLPEGFMYEDITEFSNLCFDLKREFLKIPPLNLCKQHINFLALFLPSNERGIGIGTPKDTFFRMLIDGNGHPNISVGDQERLFNLVKELELPVSYFPGPVTGEDVWCSPHSRSYGLVGIAINSKEAGMAAGFKPALAAPYRWIYESMPFLSFCIGDPSIVDPPWLARSLAHEFGHALNLEDEYELNGAAYERYSGNEPDNPNITAKEQIEDEGMIDLGKLKWFHLMTSKEMDGVTDEDPQYIIRKPDPVPEGADQESYPRYRKNAVTMVEGAMQYRSGIFKSSQECLMRQSRITLRSPSYSAGEITPGVYEYADFCRVCSTHIKEKILGDANSSPHDIPIKEVKKYWETHRMMEKLVLSLERNVDFTTGAVQPITIHRHCGTASSRIAALIQRCSGTAKIINNLRICIGDNHAYLKYKNLIIDPSFYQFYNNMDDSSRWTCRHNGEEKDIPLKNMSGDETIFLEKGFIGTLSDIKAHFWEYRPIAAGWVTPGSHEDCINSLYQLEEKVHPQFGWQGFAVSGFADMTRFPIVPGNWLQVNEILIHHVQNELKKWRLFTAEMEKPESERTWQHPQQGNIWPIVYAMYEPLYGNS